MPVPIPEKYLPLLTEKRALAHLATLMADGSPQVTPVWIDYDGQHLIVNSARGRVKDRNMMARPQVAVEIIDPDNPYNYLTVRGRVVEITEEGAAAHIDKLAKKYLGRDVYPDHRPDQTRCLYKIAPEKISANR